MNRIKSLSISGFKSIRRLDNLELRDISVLIGANGAGKSNFVTYFRMLQEMVEQRLQYWTRIQGGADRLVTLGIKETQQIESSVRFGRNGYDFVLTPSIDSSFVLKNEQLYFDGDRAISRPVIGSGHSESLLRGSSLPVAQHCYKAISRWKVFHFHDTSETARVKWPGSLIDIEYLRPDASNLAAFLFHLRNKFPAFYQQIQKTVQLAIPFFDDFILAPYKQANGEAQVALYWRQLNSDYPMWPSQLSDGSLRFICLVTALLQPHPPSTIIIDEPELGLHPYAITLLGSLLKSASKRMQVIVSTQSVPLVNQFSIEDLIIVEREEGASVFKRHNEIDYQQWLEDYSVGELWEKNILGGRPPK